MAYLTAFLIAETMRCKIGWSMNDLLEKRREEPVVGLIWSTLLAFGRKDWYKSWESSVSKLESCFLVWTGHVPNISQNRYHLSHLGHRSVKWVNLLFWYSLFKKKLAQDWDASAGSYIDQIIWHLTKHAARNNNNNNNNVAACCRRSVLLSQFVCFFLSWHLTLQSERCQRSIYDTDVLYSSYTRVRKYHCCGRNNNSFCVLLIYMALLAI
jgi:hypothetical protein